MLALLLSAFTANTTEQAVARDVKLSKEIERLEAAIDRLYGVGVMYLQQIISYYDYDYDDVTSYDLN